MGVYLSAPIVEKHSFDEQCCGFSYGTSSMQGWRVTQEDAHNCIPVFGKGSDSSFFAVYDGHGGAEVAKYCENNFPDFVKSALEKNKETDMVDLIQKAFLEFDATLTEEDVVKKLKQLAGKDDENEEDEDNDVPVGRTEADMLKAEADMPLDELLAKYKPGSSEENAEKNGESSGCSNSEPNQIQASTSSPAAEAASSSSSLNGPSKMESNTNGKETSNVLENNQSEEGIKSNNDPECSSSVDPSASSSSSGLGQRASKAKAVSFVAAECAADNSSDDDDDSEDEDILEDMSEDDDDEEDDEEDEDLDEDVPLMDMTNEEPGSDSGCTACVVLKLKDKLYVANAGDSRCVLSRDGDAVELSFDHKPEDDPERERIEIAGGKVTADGRVNGGLNLSRAFGDHVYKRNKDLPLKDQMISALPDVKTIELGISDQFLVIACDGIWNFMSSEEVVDYVKERLTDPEKRKKPSLICEELFDHCLAPNILGDGTGCDNMTCIIVVFDSAQFDSNKTNHKEVITTSDSVDDVHAEGGKDQKKSLKRPVTDNGEKEEAKRIKVDEETG